MRVQKRQQFPRSAFIPTVWPKFENMLEGALIFCFLDCTFHWCERSRSLNVLVILKKKKTLSVMVGSSHTNLQQHGRVECALRCSSAAVISKNTTAASIARPARTTCQLRVSAGIGRNNELLLSVCRGSAQDFLRQS